MKNVRQYFKHGIKMTVEVDGNITTLIIRASKQQILGFLDKLTQMNWIELLELYRQNGGSTIIQIKEEPDAKSLKGHYQQSGIPILKNDDE
jgi:hypothetical protein